MAGLPLDPPMDRGLHIVMVLLAILLKFSVTKEEYQLSAYSQLLIEFS